MKSQERHSQLQQFGRLILPTRLEIKAYALISLLLLLLVGGLSFLNDWLGIRHDVTEAGSIIKQSFDNFLDLLGNNKLTPTLVLVFFWGGVGSIVYILLWLLTNVYTALRNDIVVLKYFIKPTHYNSAKEWRNLSERLALRAAAALTILGYTVWFVTLLLPIWVNLFTSALNNWREFSSLVNAPMSWLGLALSFHIYTILIRLLLLRVRAFI